MTTITYSKLTNGNFNVNSLDGFIRRQEVKECWRKINSEFVLVVNDYIEDWNIEKCREIAKTIESGIDDIGFAYGAFCENKVVGYIYLSDHFFGSDNQYIELQLFHISEPFRRKGIGKELFRLACAEAKMMGAKKLYISAHSSKESQNAYRRLGCIDTMEINKEIAENEPFDIQMEYQL